MKTSAAAILTLLSLALLAVPATADVEFRGNVPALGQHTWKVACRAGATNVARIEGNRNAHLDLYIYDGQGRLVTQVTGFAGMSWVSWHTHRTGTFYIRVVNRDRYSNGYVLRGR